MDRDAVRGLLDEAGIDARRYRAALALLADGGWWRPADLIRETATSRRGVEALLRALSPERSGDRIRLSADQIDACRDLLGGPGGGAPGTAGPLPDTPADPVGHLLPAHDRIVERMAELIAAAPRARQALDHVAATPETVVRRALLLGARFWLPGARLLCVGDHDLTSLAVAMIHPGVDVTVVDVDDRILAYIDGIAGRLGLTVRTRWADLRLGLSGSARAQADLALTDPPYTPEGVGLFVARAVEGLRDPGLGRILLAYGAGERTPMLALKVQRSLHDLNLAVEAMYPDFNRYDGAEAIGSAADLYVLRPTTKTPPAVAARVDRYGAAIYTHGPQSVESRSGADVPADVLGGGPAPFKPDVLVGEWPADLLPKIPRVRLGTWLAKPHAAAPERVAVAVPSGLAAALPRLLLATRAGHVRVVLPEPPGDPAGSAALLSPVYRLTVAGRVLDAVRLPRPDRDAPAESRVLRRILDNAHGKLANTWREALIAERRDLTKNQARGVIAGVAPWAADVTPLDLPAHRLRTLASAVAAALREPVQTPA